MPDTLTMPEQDTEADATPAPQPVANAPKGVMPPSWQAISDHPDFQKLEQQQKQNVFTGWVSSMNQYGEANDYHPNPAEQSAINQFGAKQARDLGMATFTDPFSGRVQPVNTGQIMDFLARNAKAIGTVVGQATAYAGHLIGGTVEGQPAPAEDMEPWGKGAPPSTAPTGADIEQFGKGIEAEAAKTGTNPLRDASAEAKVAGFTGSVAPLLNPAGPAILALSMGEQGLEDAQKAGLSPNRQELTGLVGLGTGAALGKFAESIPWLQEADKTTAFRQLLTQGTGKILLQSLAKNSARDAVAGAVMNVPEQVALGQNPLSKENLSEDMESALTLGIGGGLLGTAFKGLGIADAKGIVKEQWQDANDEREASGEPQVSYQDYVKDRLKQAEPPKPAPTAEPAPEVNPVEALNARLESEISQPSSPEEKANPDAIDALHPVFGQGAYKPESLVGTMTTSDIAPGVQQLLWNGSPTDRVRRAAADDQGKPSWVYDIATPNELGNENFQRPELTRDNLEPQSVPEKEVTDNGKTNEEQIGGSESRPLLDKAELGQDVLSGDAGELGSHGGGERRSQGDDVAQAHGQEPSASPHAPDGGVNEGGGGESSAPPPTEEQKAILDRMASALGTKSPDSSKIEFSTEKDAPAWVDPRRPGKIQVNPDVLGKVLKGSDEGFGDTKQGNDYLRKLFAQKTGEEVIHVAQTEIRGTTDHEAIHDAVSEAERQATIGKYGNDSIDATKGTSPEDIRDRKILWVEEHARQILQRKALGETTEDIWKQGAKPALVRYFQALYQRIKAHIAEFGASKELSKYLKNIQGVLNDARDAGQDVPKIKSDEEIRAEDEARKEAMGELHESHETLLDAVKAVGGLATDDPELSGELQNIREAKNKGAALNLFRKNGKGLDQLREALSERGFHFETPAEMLDMIQHTLRTGKDVFPDSFAGSQVAFASNPLAAIKKLGGDVNAGVNKIRKYDDWTRAKTMFSADQQARIQESKRVQNYLRKALPDSTRDEAVTNYLAAGGDMAQLKAWADGTTDKDLKSGYEAAMHLTPEEKKIADDARMSYDKSRDLAIKWGVSIDYVPNYVNRIWKNGEERPSNAGGGGGLKTQTGHSKQRVFESSFEGEQAGFEPQTKRISDLLPAYLDEINHVIGSRKFAENVSKGKGSDGLPLIAAKFGGMTHLPNEVINTPQGPVFKAGPYIITPGNMREDYKHFRDTSIRALANWVVKGEIDGKTVFSRENMAIHPEIHDQMENIFGRSGLAKWWDSPSRDMGEAAGKASVKALFRTNRAVRTTLLSGIPVPFHAVQISAEAASHGTLTANIKEPDLSDPEVYDWAAHGSQLLPDHASRDQFMAGKDQLHDNLVLMATRWLGHLAGDKTAMAQLSDKIDRGVDYVQKMQFETFIPAQKMNFNRIVYQRNLERFKDEIAKGIYTTDDIKYLTAWQGNAAFGHLNYTDMARDPTFQHWLGFSLLAPDFFEARNRFHAGQAIKGFLGGKGGYEQSFALAAMGTAMFVGFRLANQWINGDPKYDHPFSLVVGDKAYTARTQVGDIYRLTGVPWENGHFSWRPMFANWRTWLSGRESPMARFAGEALSGVNYRGEPTSIAGAIKDALAGAVPIPAQAALSPLTHQLPSAWQDFIAPPNVKNNPISPFEQALGSLGIQTSRYSPISSTYQMASSWKAEHGQEFGIQPSNEVFPTSPYTPLEYALDDGDHKRASQLYQDLLDSKKGNAYKVATGLRDSLKKPFTGGDPAAERAFVASLSDADKATYEAAIARRQLLMERFGQMREQMPSK